MPLTTDTPYKRDVFTIKQYGKHIQKITYCAFLRESGWEDTREHTPKGTKNDEKLANNLSRAKARVKELALCNPWDYWCTFTLDEKIKNRFDVDNFHKDFSEFLHNYNRRCEEKDKVRYLLIPEQHKDNAWHMHGFIKGIREKDLFINDNGYLSWRQYNKKFGFITFSKMRSQEKCSSYALKYMTKNPDKNITELGAHLYYASKGLKTAVELYRGNGLFKGQWDYEHPDGYCKIKTIDTRVNNVEEFLDYDL